MTYVFKSQKEIRTDWPITKGTTAGTTSQKGTQMNLVPEGLLGIKTRVLKKDRRGIY